MALISEFISHSETIGATVSLMHCHEHPLPICDGGPSFSHAEILPQKAAIEAADAILIVAPVYNYTLNSAFKTLLEHTGKSWTRKVVGFMVTAGGEKSYMALMPVANSLMLDFRCVIVPRFVYVTGAAFRDNVLTDVDAQDRVRSLAEDMQLIGDALQQYTNK